MENVPVLQLLYAGTLFVFGAFVGSFLNVVAYRVPLEISLLEPPSSCPACGKQILSRDNVPFLGWLLLRGKCRACAAPISLRYPLAELATALLWAMTGWRLATMEYGYWYNVATGLLFLAFVSSMVVTFLVDIDFLIILDEISLGGAAVALAASALLPSLHNASTYFEFAEHYPLIARLMGEAPLWACRLVVSTVGLAAGLGFSLAIYYLGNIAFKAQIEAAQQEDPEIDSALGLGDVKLMAFFGALLGWQAVLFIFVVGSVLGAVIGSVMKILSGDPAGQKGLAGLRRRWSTGDSVLPFGPFLVIAALVFFFWGESILAMFFAFLQF